MANVLYDKAKEAFLSAAINWDTDTIKCVLVDAGYTPNTTTDQFLADIPGGSIIATSPALTGASDTSGVADASDVTFSAVSGSTADYIVIYKDTGSSATSPLIAVIDTATGLPVTPAGGDITVAWDTGADKIFAL